MRPTRLHPGCEQNAICKYSKHDTIPFLSVMGALLPFGRIYASHFP
jgi:hypothetical protein